MADKDNRFVSRRPLPERGIHSFCFAKGVELSVVTAWRGLRDAELSAKSGIPGAIFVRILSNVSNYAVS